MKEKNIIKKDSPVSAANSNGRQSGGETLQPWHPTYLWLAKTAGIIFVSLIILFFALNLWLKPYMRQIPPEITPWLEKGE
jgi:hypothetical protein